MDGAGGTSARAGVSVSAGGAGNGGGSGGGSVASGVAGPRSSSLDCNDPPTNGTGCNATVGAAADVGIGRAMAPA
jgi:hypothetical protein